MRRSVHTRLLALLFAAPLSIALGACGDDDDTPLVPTDSGTDAGMTDLGSDADVDDDAGPIDGGVDEDGGSDLGMADGGPDALPAIVTPAAHAVPAAAAGHDRYYGVAFAPDSSFYVTGTYQAGTATTAAKPRFMIGAGLSMPNQTPVTRCDVYPMNHASV